MLLARIILLRAAVKVAIFIARTPRLRRAVATIEGTVIAGRLVYCAARVVLARAAVRLVGDEPSELLAGAGFILLIVAIIGWGVAVGGRP